MYDNKYWCICRANTQTLVHFHSQFVSLQICCGRESPAIRPTRLRGGSDDGEREGAGPVRELESGVRGHPGVQKRSVSGPARVNRLATPDRFTYGEGSCKKQIKNRRAGPPRWTTAEVDVGSFGGLPFVNRDIFNWCDSLYSVVELI